MSDHATTPPRDALIAAMRDISTAYHKQAESYEQQAIAVSVIAREGALAAETAERAENAAKQAIMIAREVRDLAKDIDTNLKAQQQAFADFFGEVLGEFGKLSQKVKALEDAREDGRNGHG